MSYVLGVDLGTSSLKAILVDETGQEVASSSAEYDLHTPEPGYSEQDPSVWLKALEQVVAGVEESVPGSLQNIKGISFSGQMHSLVLLDQKDQVLRNAILWNDVRTTSQCVQIREQLGERLVAITGNDVLEGFTLPKILWVKEHEPEIWEKAAAFLLPKDYLGFWLTGNKQMDFSDASGTSMLDIRNKQWSEEIRETFSIPETLYPKLVESTDKIGTVRPEIAEKLGLSTETEVFAGGADNAIAAVSAGVVSKGTGLVSIGTSGVFLKYEGEEFQNYNGKLHFFMHAKKDSYYSMGVTLAAGYSLKWYRDTFHSGKSYDEIVEPITEIPPGAEGLRFTPYIVGERTPHNDSQIRGSFTGIDARHNAGHFTRAVLEGITYSLKDSQKLMAALTDVSLDKIVSLGGGAKNKTWMQMQADIFESNIVPLKQEQGPAFGAAIVAAVGVKWFESIDACVSEWIDHGTPFEADAERSAAYQAAYEQYQQLYPALSSVREAEPAE